MEEDFKQIGKREAYGGIPPGYFEALAQNAIDEAARREGIERIRRRIWLWGSIAVAAAVLLFVMLPFSGMLTRTSPDGMVSAVAQSTGIPTVSDVISGMNDSELDALAESFAGDTFYE